MDVVLGVSLAPNTFGMVLWKVKAPAGPPAALAQAVGGATSCARTALLFVEPHAGERPSISKNVVAPTQAPALQPGGHPVNPRYPGHPPRRRRPQCRPGVCAAVRSIPDSARVVAAGAPRDRFGWGHRRLGRGILVP